MNINDHTYKLTVVIALGLDHCNSVTETKRQLNLTVLRTSQANNDGPLRRREHRLYIGLAGRYTPPQLICGRHSLHGVSRNNLTRHLPCTQSPPTETYLSSNEQTVRRMIVHIHFFPRLRLAGGGARGEGRGATAVRPIKSLNQESVSYQTRKPS